MNDTPPPTDTPSAQEGEPSINSSTEEALSSPPSPDEAQGLGEWLWRGRALREVRNQPDPTTATQQRYIQLARAAAEQGDRALDPVDPLRNGSSIPFAISLYREAVYWALLAQEGAPDATSLREAFLYTDPAFLLAAARSPEELATIQHALCDRDFIATATVPPSQLEAEARAISLFLQVLLSQLVSAKQIEQRLLLQRWGRVLGLLLLIAGLIGGAVFGVIRWKTKPNLAAGKPWKASSALFPCYPLQHRCGGITTDILFHTREEENPWFEIDLQMTTTFSRFDVYNRSDCCFDRAVPLVLEVSNDGQHWAEVARRDVTFGVWTATFAPQQMRYVRARSLRRTTLHLEGMAVR